MPFSFISLFRSTRGWNSPAHPQGSNPCNNKKTLLEECGVPTPTPEERSWPLGSSHSHEREGSRDLLFPHPRPTPPWRFPCSRRDS